MQREAGFELLKEKIEWLTSENNASVKNSTDASSLKRSLFEIQILAKQLYPNNETLKTILNRRDLSKVKQGATDLENTINIEMIKDRAKEIALAIGLELETTGQLDETDEHFIIHASNKLRDIEMQKISKEKNLNEIQSESKRLDEHGIQLQNDIKKLDEERQLFLDKVKAYNLAKASIASEFSGTSYQPRITNNNSSVSTKGSSHAEIQSRSSSLQEKFSLYEPQITESEFSENEFSIINNDLEVSENKQSKESAGSSESSESFSPRETAEKVAKTDMHKVNTSTFSTFILAILAGALIALGGIYFTFATSQKLVTLPFTQVLGGVAFSMGLMFVVITGAQMFTGNNLGLMNLASRTLSPARLLKNWSIVYAGNFVGASATALVLYMSHAWTNNGYQYGIRALMVASHKTSLSFSDAFFLGILCNCLVCLAIWLAASGKKVSDKILAIIFPVSAFVAIGFEHCVANMYFLSFAFLVKNDPMLISAMNTAGVTVDTSHITYMGIIGNLLPVTLGNIVGGGIFVGLMYWLAYVRKNNHHHEN